MASKKSDSKKSNGAKSDSKKPNNKKISDYDSSDYDSGSMESSDVKSNEQAISKGDSATGDSVATNDNAEQRYLEINGNTEAPKKVRGDKKASITANLKGDREDIARIIRGSVQFLKQPRVQSDEECAERLEWYFDMCASRGQIPTVEDMCLALGVTRTAVNKWEHGENCSEKRVHIVKRAKEILAAIDARLVSEGRIPQVTYIFRAKNFFGMKDQQDVVVTPNNPMGSESDQAALAEKYKDAIEVDE